MLYTTGRAEENTDMSQKSKNYCVYVLEFPFIEDGREAYVGLTWRGAKVRYNAHMLENLTIKENMENGEESVGKILEDGLTQADAVLKEKEWLAFYNRTGWDMLNRAPAGSTGAPEGGAYWTLETCKADALEHDTRNDWQKARGGGWVAAQRNGWIEECCAHMVNGYVGPKKWPLEACKADALKYNTKIEWRKARGSGYAAAHRNGWIEECCSHMIDGRGPYKWPLEACRADALKHETKLNWQKTRGGGYSAASKNGWIEECCLHMNIHKQITSKGTYSLLVLPRFTLAIGMYEGACYSTPLRDEGEPDFASWKKFDAFENTELCEFIRKNYEVTDEDQFYYLSKALPNAL